MTLYKKTNKGNIRCYIIDIYASLFGGYNVERIYGNINFKTHTGKRINHFSSYEDSKNFLNEIKIKKENKGYVCKF